MAKAQLVRGFVFFSSIAVVNGGPGLALSR
jgi:hypothetical protein